MLPKTIEIANALNAFAIDLYKASCPSNGSTFLSPFGVATMLAMLYVGAREQTEEEIGNALNLRWSGETLSRNLASILSEVRESPTETREELDMANALWIRQDLIIKPQYLDWIQKYFGGELFEVDFRRLEESRAQVNMWVSEQTRGKLREALPKSLFSSGPDPLAFIILNVIYFYRRWLHPFDREWTSNQPFYLLDGRKIILPLMRVITQVKFAKRGGTQYVELPYSGGAVAMGILLPGQRDGLPQVEAELTIGQLNYLIDTCQLKQIIILIPRFTIESTFELVPTFQQLGVRSAFDRDKADFSGIIGGAYLRDAFHRTRVEVDEEGTVAASVVAVSGALRGSSMPSVFRADHPFLFFIRHVKTGQILFMGRWTGI